MLEKLPQQEKREDPDIEKYLDIIIKRGEMMRRPNPEDFSDVWDKEKIEKDTAYVEKMRAKIEQYDDVVEKKAKALEVLAAYYIENMQWLGEGSHAVMTSDYDDIAHGIDMVTEFEGEDVKRLGLAIDAYSGKSISNFDKKAERFMGAVRGETDPETGGPYMDRVTRVDYFSSKIKDDKGNIYKGGLDKLPPVALAISGHRASDLFKATSEVMSAENIAGPLQYRKQKGEKLTPVEQEMLERSIEKLKRAKIELRKHPAKQLFIKEIVNQLETYLEVAEVSESSDGEFVDNIRSAYNAVKELEDKEADLEDLQEDLDRLKEVFEKFK